MVEFRRDLLPDPETFYQSEGLELIGNGRERKALCVFHGERSPSLFINIDTGAFYCHGCHAGGGDVLDFHRLRHGSEFMEAAEALGAVVDDGKPQARKTTISPRAALMLLEREAQLVAVAAANVSHGVQLSDDDKQRVLLAAGRILAITKEHCHA
jgi:DNA primase